MAKSWFDEVRSYTKKEFKKLKIIFKIPKAKLIIHQNNFGSGWFSEPNIIHLSLTWTELHKSSFKDKIVQYLFVRDIKADFMLTLLHEICHVIQYKEKRYKSYEKSFNDMWALELECIKFARKHFIKLYSDMDLRDDSIKDYKKFYKNEWINVWSKP